jgi:hypothetical protein
MRGVNLPGSFLATTPIQSPDQLLNIFFVIEEVRGDPKALRLFGDDHAASEEMANDFARPLNFDERLT